MGWYFRMGWVATGTLLLMTACTKSGEQEGGGLAASPDDAKLASLDAVSTEDPRTQANLESIVFQLHPGEPMMVDAVTRLDSVLAGTNGKTLRFHYTVVDNAAAAKIAENAGPFQQEIQGRLCTGLEMSKVLQDGFELSMEYVDGIGRRLAHFYVDKSKCPGAQPA